MSDGSPPRAKRSPADLALFGGARAFARVLHVGRPAVGDRSRLSSLFEGLVDSRVLTNDGPLVKEFEQRVAEACGVPHCVVTANATAGLEILVRACGLHGEVIVPAFTFIASAHALEWMGIKPVFCDVDPRTHTLDPRRVEELVTPATTAVLGVHLWGQVCDVEGLRAVCERHGLKLLFDAAHAFGCRRDGMPAGQFGDAEVLSFHATKFVQSCEGGAIVTRDAEIARRARLMRNFGFEYLDRVGSRGTNAKMPEACAAMGLVSLDAMEEFRAINAARLARYRRGLAGIAGLELHEAAAQDAGNHHYVVARVDPAALGLQRDQLLALLMAEGVFARRYFHPGCHRMAPYASRPVLPWLPVTEQLSASVLQLPSGQGVADHEVDAVCDLIRFIATHAPAIASRGVPLDMLEPGGAAS